MKRILYVDDGNKHKEVKANSSRGFDNDTWTGLNVQTKY